MSDDFGSKFFMDRYRRQLIIDEIGLDGQKKICNSRVLVVGLGGLGSPIAMYLTAAGIGNIGLLDFDNVDISNLQRQILHSTDRIGENKAVSAYKRLVTLNPHINFVVYNEKIVPMNAKKIISQYEIVISAVDSIETRYLLNKICCDLKKPLIEGAISNLDGYAMTIIPNNSACYQCAFPQEEILRQKSEIGVIGALPGIIGSIQSMECLKIVLGIGNPIVNKILYFNGLNSSFREIKISKKTDCPVCNKLS